VILVDTSVWIDYFAGRQVAHVSRLEQLLLDDADLALCGILLTEILQGISDDETFERVRRYMQFLLMLPLVESTYVDAARIYRGLRKSGVTIRKTNDCIIAAAAIEHGCELLHNDRDFAAIAAHYPLRLVA